MSESFPEILQAVVAQPERCAFLFDFDGTMVDFAANPDDVWVPPSLIDDLRAVAGRKNIGFAIVTGRPLSKLDYFMKGVTTVALGSHGAEWRKAPGAPSESIAEPMPPDIRNALIAAGQRHKCIIEDKFFTLSLHLPFERADEDMMQELVAAAGTENYFVRRTGRTYEILQKGVTKGTGIRFLMRQPAFVNRMPVYIGDDAHLDTSLDTVTEMGGLMFAIAHQSPHAPPNPRARLTVRDACRVVASLAKE